MEEVDLEGGPDPSLGGPDPAAATGTPIHPPECSISKDSNPATTGPTDTPDVVPENSTDIKVNKEAEEGEEDEASDHISQVIEAPELLITFLNVSVQFSRGVYFSKYYGLWGKIKDM